MGVIHSYQPAESTEKFDQQRFEKAVESLSKLSECDFSAAVLEKLYEANISTPEAEKEIGIHDHTVESFFDDLQYYLAYYQCAETKQCNIASSEYCNCKWNELDDASMLHYILYHTKGFEEMQLRRTARRRREHGLRFRFTRDECNQSIANHPMPDTSGPALAETTQDLTASAEQGTNPPIIHRPVSKKQPLRKYSKPLPDTPPALKARKHTKSRSAAGCITQSTSPPAKDPSLEINAFPKEGHKTELHALPEMLSNSDSSSSEASPTPPLYRNQNHQTKVNELQRVFSDVRENPLPPLPRTPSRIKKKRSMTLVSRELQNSHPTMNDRVQYAQCGKGDCFKLREFLEYYRADQLQPHEEEDEDEKEEVKMSTPSTSLTSPGARTFRRRRAAHSRRTRGKRHIYYDHCLEFHSGHYEECLVVHCQWDEHPESEMHQIHGHFFHNFPMKNVFDAYAKEQRQRFTVTTKGKYLQTFSSLVNGKHGQMSQMDFGYKYEILHAEDAKFNNPKAEILHNDYYKIKIKEWNDLLKRAVFFNKKPESRRIALSMKETVSLKLYTDFDGLQRDFRKCFRDPDPMERRKRQKQFYYWYRQLENAMSKSQTIITQKVYHGIDIKLPPSTFFGVYHGPVSTTVSMDVAFGFAGSTGQVIELYPSYGKRGLDVSFLSNFPEEKEVLFMDCTFQISHVYVADEMEATFYPMSSANDQSAMDVYSSKYIEQSVMKALQLISIETRVISLNISRNDKNDTTGFNMLTETEKICILHLLYLQYRATEWDSFCQQAPHHMAVAMAQSRDMFVSLANNVKAVRMEKLPNLLQMFFYTPQTEYQFPIRSENLHDDIKTATALFKPNQPILFETVCLLFPNAEQISVNAENWDFSLKTFIGFLEIFDSDFANVGLQDIYIRFVSDDGKILVDNRRARKERKSHADFNANLKLLRKYGWAFITPSHLHRVGFEPLPELPFLRLFLPPARALSPLILFQSYSTRFSVATYLSSLNLKDMQQSALSLKIDENDDEEKEGANQMGELGEENAFDVVLVDNNPKNCTLTNRVFSNLEYKEKLIKQLRARRDYGQFIQSQLEERFSKECGRVEVLVLDPMPDELREIFCDNVMEPGSQAKKKIISFEKVCKIFPNVHDLFLRNTTFNPRICKHLIRFLQSRNGDSLDKSKHLKLERIFFSKEKPLYLRNLPQIESDLNTVNWTFIQSEQTVLNQNVP